MSGISKSVLDRRVKHIKVGRGSTVQKLRTLSATSESVLAEVSDDETLAGQNPSKAAYRLMQKVSRAVDPEIKAMGISNLDKLQSLKTEPCIKLLLSKTWRDFFEEDPKKKTKSPDKSRLRNALRQVKENRQPDESSQDLLFKLNELFFNMVQRIEGLWVELKIPLTEREFYRKSLCKGPPESLDRCRDLSQYISALKCHRNDIIRVLRSIKIREILIRRFYDILSAVHRRISRRESIQRGGSTLLDPMGSIIDTRGVVPTSGPQGISFWHEELIEILKDIQIQTLLVIRNIQSWRISLWRPQPFLFEGINYLSKIRLDMSDMLDEMILQELEQVPIFPSDLTCVLFRSAKAPTTVGSASSLGALLNLASSSRPSSAFGTDKIRNMRQTTIPKGDAQFVSRDPSSTGSALRTHFLTCGDIRIADLKRAEKLVLDEESLQEALLTEKQILSEKKVFIPSVTFVPLRLQNTESAETGEENTRQLATSTSAFGLSEGVPATSKFGENTGSSAGKIGEYAGFDSLDKADMAVTVDPTEAETIRIERFMQQRLLGSLPGFGGSTVVDEFIPGESIPTRDPPTVSNTARSSFAQIRAGEDVDMGPVTRFNDSYVDGVSGPADEVLSSGLDPGGSRGDGGSLQRAPAHDPLEAFAATASIESTTREERGGSAAIGVITGLETITSSAHESRHTGQVKPQIQAHQPQQVKSAEVLRVKQGSVGNHGDQRQIQQPVKHIAGDNLLGAAVSESSPVPVPAFWFDFSNSTTSARSALSVRSAKPSRLREQSSEEWPVSAAMAGPTIASAASPTEQQRSDTPFRASGSVSASASLSAFRQSLAEPADVDDEIDGLVDEALLGAEAEFGVARELDGGDTLASYQSEFGVPLSGQKSSSLELGVLGVEDELKDASKASKASRQSRSDKTGRQSEYSANYGDQQSQVSLIEVPMKLRDTSFQLSDNDQIEEEDEANLDHDLDEDINREMDSFLAKVAPGFAN